MDTATVLTYRSLPSLSSLALGESAIDRALLETELTAAVVSLATQKMFRRVQLLVENLVVDGEIPRFYGVELVAPTGDEYQALFQDPLIRKPHTNAIGFANVNAPGDSTFASEWGIRQVERFINLLQGCGFEVMMGSVYPVHLIDRNPVVESTVIRTWTTDALRTTLWTQHGSPKLRHVRVREDLMSNFSNLRLERLRMASTTTNNSEILDAVVASLELLGEACKPNLAPTRILLASTALEMLAGSQGSNDLSFRSQNAAIAERTTFLVAGQAVAERRDFDRKVRKLYGKGSAVRHGGRADVSLDEIVALGSIARRVAIELLDRSDQIKTFLDLDDWVQNMRYTTDTASSANE